MSQPCLPAPLSVPPAVHVAAAEPRPTLSWRIPLEGKLWLVFSAALWGTGLYKGINLITLLAYVMLLVWCLNFVLSRRQVRRLSVRRWTDAPAHADMPIHILVELHHAGAGTRRAVRLEERGAEHALFWFHPVLCEGSRSRYRGEVTLPRRGWYDWQPLRAVSSHPFGLVEHSSAEDRERPVLIYPALGCLHRGRLRRLLESPAALQGELQQRPRFHAAAQAEFHALREFRGGDSPRWIHWRTTARRGELMVREFEDFPAERLIVILEPWLPEAHAARAGPASASTDPSADELLERAVSLAASIAAEWCRQSGDHFVLALAGPSLPIVFNAATNPAFGLLLLEALALVCGCNHIDVDQLVERLAAESLPSAPICVITTHASDVPARIAQRLHRPVATINVADERLYDFFEMPKKK